jgi:hypothetical protein
MCERQWSAPSSTHFAVCVEHALSPQVVQTPISSIANTAVGS